MELRHLRYFIGVAEELHFARAAQQLGISQPPLSQQIAALERILGVQLFDRTSRSVKLTSAGTAFLPVARATLEQAERAAHVARRAARGELGELCLGFNASAPFIPSVARAIHEFRQEYPDVNLVLTELPSRASKATALVDHAVDVCFVRSNKRPEPCSSIEVTPVLHERMVVAMHPEHPLATRETLSLRDLAEVDLLIYIRENGMTPFTEELLATLRNAGVEPRIAHSVGDVASLFGLAAAGLGVTVLAESLCALQSAKLVYRPLTGPETETATWLLHLRDAPSLPCRNFIRHVRASISLASHQA